ncbi:MAG: D-alanyl-D-alanine carboxypeptidase, partial [Anaerovoracaceae bacterium]|nr:D-alanyl-D-alanine carboxypeptidase [Anaerovoracaceae bacterium]
MIRVKKIFSVLLIVVMAALVSVTTPGQALASSEAGTEKPVIDGDDYITHAKAGILYEATTDTVIYEKNKDMQLPPASMTKVMTAILVLEANPELEGELTVDPRAVSSMYCSSMVPLKHLKEGEVISYR